MMKFEQIHQLIALLTTRCNPISCFSLRGVLWQFVVPAERFRVKSSTATRGWERKKPIEAEVLMDAMVDSSHSFSFLFITNDETDGSMSSTIKKRTLRSSMERVLLLHINKAMKIELLNNKNVC